MRVHPVALVLPEMDDDRYQELKADIEKHGVRVPIVTWNSQIIDGRHRARACDELGARCPVTVSDVDEDELPALVWSLNGHRRDLTASQRGIIGAKLANLAVGSNQHAAKEGPPSGGGSGQPVSKTARADAAALVGVGTTTIDRGLIVLRSGDGDLIDKVEKGRVSLAAAAESVMRPRRKKSANDIVPLASGPQRKLPVIPANKRRENAVRQLAQIASVFETEDGAPLPDIETITEWLNEFIKPSLPIITQFRRKLEQEIENAKHQRSA